MRTYRPSKPGGRKWLFLILLVVLVAAVAAVAIYREQIFPTRTSTLMTESTANYTLRNIGVLVTQEAFMTRVHSESDARKLFGITWPGTQRRLIFSYDVVVRAGVDFSKTQLKVDTWAKTVTVTLPAATVFDANIDTDSFRVYDQTNNVFNRTGASTFNNAIKTMLKEGEAYATGHGLLENATKNAESMIKGLLAQSYPEPEYTYTFEWIDE